MEAVSGLSVPELNDYLYAYLEYLPSGDKYKVSAADSIWFKDESLTVEPGLSPGKCRLLRYSIYKAAFDDAALKDVNAWVNDKTDGMIEDILDKIPDEAVMYLVIESLTC